MPWVKSGNTWSIDQSDLDNLVAEGFRGCPSGCRTGIRMSETWIDQDEQGRDVKHALCASCGMELVVTDDDGGGI
jgi:hypothetical protein